MKLLALAARVAREGSIVVATVVAFAAGSVAQAVPAGMNGSRPAAHNVSDLGIGIASVGAGAFLVHGGIALAGGTALAVGGGVVIGALGVAAIGYGGYRLYKFLTAKKADTRVVAPRPTAPGTIPGSNIGRGTDTRPPATTGTNHPTSTGNGATSTPPARTPLPLPDHVHIHSIGGAGVHR